MKLALNELEAAPCFFTDRAGRVYFDDDDNVLRVIKGKRAEYVINLLNAPFVSALFDIGLVHAEVTNLDARGYDLVLKHPRIFAESHWSEWCTYMLKDALLMVLDLNLYLADYGMLMDDVKPGNVVFNYSRPVWLDWGALNRINQIDVQAWMVRLWKTFVFPFWLISWGQHGVGREIFKEVPEKGVQGFLFRKPLKYLPFWFYRRARQVNHENFPDIVRALRRQIAETQVEPFSLGWRNYRQEELFEDRQEISIKELNVEKIFRSLPRGVVLDLGSNLGWFSLLAEELGHRVIAVDADDDCVCNLYTRCRNERRRILPVLLNVAFPTPSYGIGLFGRNAYERLQADCVAALAVSHHLIVQYGLSLEGILRLFSNFARQYVIFDFPDAGDVTIDGKYGRADDWYSWDEVYSLLWKLFRQVETYESYPENRRLFVCKK